MKQMSFTHWSEAPRSNARLKLGYLGFWGFAGFAYFATGWPAFFLFFALYGLFGWFFLQKAYFDKHDERYVVNQNEAKSAAILFAVALMLLVAVLLIFNVASQEALVIVCSGGIGAVFFVYCIAFWLLDRR